MQLQVNPTQRYAKMRAHTATHLLHAELGKIFPQTKQAGSLVDQDYLRFDFYADRLLSDSEIALIENSVNSLIAQACDVTVEQKSFAEATQGGAKAFFEDKYGDVVRVVSILNPQPGSDKEMISVELCGGTHVANTKDIGSFVIVGQQAVASGIKRIVAYVGPKVRDYIQEKNTALLSLAGKLDCSVGQLEEKVSKLVSDYNHMQEEIEKNNKNILQSAQFEKKEISGISYNFLELGIGAYQSLSVKDAQILAKQGFSENTLIIDANKGFLIYSPHKHAKKIMTEFGRKGGGSDVLCQGKVG